jgi:ribosomal protein S18 acetylase RimI-like enzyme
MADPALDNPVWGSLKTCHACFGVMRKHAGRYPADVAPFVAVSASGAQAAGQLGQIVHAGESVYLVGVAPDLGSGWEVHYATTAAQMLCASPAPVCDGPEVIVMSESNRADMVALTGLVYPGFFRARTAEMGQYRGIYVGNVLAAMAGERMRPEGYQEISGVCTHPQFVGRGYAQRLVAQLTNACLERGVRPFLHVNHENARAIKVYERIGYQHRQSIALLHLTRRS